MTAIETTPILAKDLLDSKKRIIKATKGDGLFSVKWININNNTCGLSSRKGHEITQNNEDYKFFIQVPNKAKKIF
jgi:hypothetical protein